MVKTANNGMPADQRRWIGIDPWLRLYHVIDELKEKFVQRDRQELDRPDKTNFWDDASAFFNDPEYKPWTYKLAWLHSEFNASFQIEKEKCPSNVNGEQLKKKLAEARMKLLSHPSKPRVNPVMVQSMDDPRYECWKTFLPAAG